MIVSCTCNSRLQLLYFISYTLNRAPPELVPGVFSIPGPGSLSTEALSSRVVPKSSLIHCIEVCVQPAGFSDSQLASRPVQKTGSKRGFRIFAKPRFPPRSVEPCFGPRRPGRRSARCSATRPHGLRAWRL